MINIHIKGKNDLEQIYLTNEEKNLLNKFKSGKPLKADLTQIMTLVRHGLVQKVIKYQDGIPVHWKEQWKLSDNGKRFLQYTAERKAEKDKQNRFQIISMLIPIVTFILGLFTNQIIAFLGIG